MSELLERIRLMRAHCAARGAAPGSYWEAISDRLVRQLELLPPGQDWFSDRTPYAATFSGAPFNGAPLAAEMDRSLSFRLWKKVENALMRLPAATPLAGALLRRVHARKRVRHYLLESGISYAILTRALHALSQAEVERFDLRSPACYGQDLVDCGGRLLSAKTLRDFNTFLRFSELLDPSSKTFVEIGAGLGELARIFLATGRAERYVIVDIPPTLAYSERLLLSQFPPEKLSLFDPARARVDFSDGRLCHFLTPDQVGLIPAFDAGINVASFGEMTRDIVSGYASSLKRSGLREFLSANQRLAKDHNPDSLGQDQYESFFAPELVLRGRWSFPANAPIVTLPPDRPGVQGYQLLHFRAAGF